MLSDKDPAEVPLPRRVLPALGITFVLLLATIGITLPFYAARHESFVLIFSTASFLAFSGVAWLSALAPTFMRRHRWKVIIGVAVFLGLLPIVLAIVLPEG